MRLLNPIFSLAVLSLCYFTSAAQERIDTDRPDQTESAFTVPKNYFQWEAGLIFEHTNTDQHVFSIPTSLFKYGVSKRFELRLETEFNRTVALIPSIQRTISGLQPVEVGFKVGICEEKSWIPKTSLIAHLGIPNLASEKYRAPHLAPSFRFTMQTSINETTALGYNLGAEWDGYSSTPIWLYTFAPGFDIGENWYGYIEAFGFMTRGETPAHSIDAGIAYYINKDLKIDFSTGFGLSKAAPDYYLAIGGSIRFK
jgi:hypothetical protein